MTESTSWPRGKIPELTPQQMHDVTQALKRYLPRGSQVVLIVAPPPNKKNGIVLMHVQTNAAPEIVTDMLEAAIRIKDNLLQEPPSQ